MTPRERNQALGRELLPVVQRLSQVVEALADPGKRMPALPYRNVRVVIQHYADRIIQELDRDLDVDAREKLREAPPEVYVDHGN